jgi:hypothetical protein
MSTVLPAVASIIASATDPDVQTEDPNVHVNVQVLNVTCSECTEFLISDCCTPKHDESENKCSLL